ncbi:MAG: hypothetical protein OXI77_13835 [Chloroflexota bacterium]|nr:hypothetical protein [Chloroflexota bacterium]MDE2909089.1 hypothetical protein [Chloroflexota bacterium]
MTLPRSRIYALLMSAATAALLFSFVVYLIYAANLLSFPYDYDQGEGFELHDTVLYSRFQLPYGDTESYPFYGSIYPPLFHVMAAPFVWFFGPAYWYGRLLGFLGSLLSAAAIYYAVCRDGRGNRWIALLSALAFLSSNFVYHIGPLYRQHTMMVTFETLAVVVLAGAFPRRCKRGIAIGILFLICAGYTKQLAAFTALAAFAWMFLRQPGRALRCLLVFALAGAAVFLWLNIATDGQWWLQTIVANVNDIILDQAFGLLILWVKLHGLLLIPAALLIIYELYLDRLSLYSVWFVFSALLGSIAASKWGAGDSYFVTSIAAACILSGIFFSRILANDWRLPRQIGKTTMIKIANASLIIVPLLYLGYARATLKMPTAGAFAPLAAALGVEGNVREDFYDSATFFVGGYARIGYLLGADDRAAGDEITRLIVAADGPVLSEEAGFALAAGRDVVGNPAQLRNLHLAGRFDGSQLIEMIDGGEFGIIVLRAHFYPPPVLHAIARRYEQTHTIHMNGFDYMILHPKALDDGSARSVGNSG